MDSNYYSFWKWFSVGTGAKPGYRNLLSWHLIFHALAAYVFVAFFMPISIYVLAHSIFFSLAVIFSILLFSCSGNFYSLVQSKEIRKISKIVSGGVSEYLGYFQMVLLLVLTSLGSWALVGLDIFRNYETIIHPSTIEQVVAFFLFAFTLLALEECWCVYNITQHLIFCKNEIAEAEEKK
jgi:hypothetical protein